MHTLNRYKGYQTIRPVANTTETAGTGRYTTDNQWFRHEWFRAESTYYYYFQQVTGTIGSDC